jgi:hypothetical protein
MFSTDTPGTCVDHPGGTTFVAACGSGNDSANHWARKTCGWGIEKDEEIRGSLQHGVTLL